MFYIVKNDYSLCCILQFVFGEITCWAGKPLYLNSFINHRTNEIFALSDTCLFNYPLLLFRYYSIISGWELRTPPKQYILLTIKIRKDFSFLQLYWLYACCGDREIKGASEVIFLPREMRSVEKKYKNIPTSFLHSVMALCDTAVQFFRILKQIPWGSL
jgi:hypothetical protein